MPNEQIATVVVTDDHVYKRALHVVWGRKGGRPEAPDGWVNAGYAQIQIRDDHGETGELVGFSLDPREIERLIQVLKRARRQAFRTYV